MNYSIPTLQKLIESFQQQSILRPLKRRRYDPGDKLTYDIQGIAPPHKGRIHLKVITFVGGGFAGQVYQVQVLSLDLPEGPIPGLEIGQKYAIKILVPPTGFAKWFRNLMYGLGFQGAFSLQVNPAAARSGALWHKFIRRAAKQRLGSETAVVDILATFVDPTLKSCGDILEWIDGRMWRFEIDDNLDARKKWRVGMPGSGLGSPEYRAKKTLRGEVGTLMQEMGAWELARQYQWWTCKSQPNVLKRLQEDTNPETGHVAVDFRAGLALLPFLPQSPVDIKLIWQGLIRGSLVQFDRGNLSQLQRFMQNNSAVFIDMQAAFKELKEQEKIYRTALPDITHHHVRLLYSRTLWHSILDGSTQSLLIRRLIDEPTSQKLFQKHIRAFWFFILGLIPILGKFFRRLLGHRLYRNHLRNLFTSWSYLLRTWKARRAEALIRWHRSGRVDEKRALHLNQKPLRFMAHLPLSLLPPGLHRFFSDRRFARLSLDNIFIRPLRLYFKSAVREEWLRTLVAQGEKGGMLTNEEAEHIRTQIKEPFIQKYLKSLAVHICTVPVTQIVSVLVAIIYVRMRPELSWQEASVHAGLILGLFQVIPISPGSLVRGLYVTFLVLRERNFKDYNLAFFLSFFKYIGYLAFPIQMAYRYPDLARFMAGHWATEAVHIVPVFGERGALLEHAVFDRFYNFPLTIRRRIQKRKEQRANLSPRYWHILFCVLAGCAVLAGIDLLFYRLYGHVPQFKEIWWIGIWLPALTAALVTFGSGGASLARRFTSGVVSGILLGFIYAINNAILHNVLSTPGHINPPDGTFWGQAGVPAIWLGFLFCLMAVLGVFIFETRPLRN